MLKRQTVKSGVPRRRINFTIISFSVALKAKAMMRPVTKATEESRELS